MLRRFNYTGRKRIVRQDVRVSLTHGFGAPPRATVSLDLADYELPGVADVYLECYRQTYWARFHLGQVEDLWDLGPHVLPELDDPEGILFRVRVSLSSSDGRRLLAEADGVPWTSPKDSGGRRESILPVRGEDLGDEFWRLSITERPWLLVNTRIGPFREVARHPCFLPMAYPACMRQVLIAIVDGEDTWDADDSTAWQSKWLRFVRDVLGVELFDEHDDMAVREEWVDRAVDAFCRRQRFVRRFAAQFWEDQQ